MIGTFTEYELHPLRELLAKCDSGTWGDEAEYGDGSPVLRSTNISDGQLSLEEPAWRLLSASHAKQKRLNGGDIIVTASSGSTNHIGKCAVFTMPQDNGTDYYFSNFTMRLTSKADVLHHKWLYYWLTSPRGRHEMFRLNNTTSGLRNINKDAYLAQQIPVPPLEEQKRIAAILDKADAVRRKRREVPVIARGAVCDFFINMFGDSNSNQNGYDTMPISEVATVITGNTPSRKETANYGDVMEWIKSDNINTPFHYLTEATERLSTEGVKKSRTAPSGSTLVTCIAGTPDCIGNAALANRPVAFNQQINAVVPGERLIDKFLYSMILVLKPAIQQLSSKSMKGMVNKGRFETLMVVVPPLPLQEEFVRQFDVLANMAKKMDSASQEADDLFNSLVQRAFRGKL